MATEELLELPSLADGGAEMLAWTRRMRADRPLWVDAQHRYYVFRYADVQAVLSDPARFSSNLSRAIPLFAEERVKANLPMQDPPAHRVLRQLVSQAFTAKRIADLRPRIAEICRELLATVPAGEFDFVEHVAYPLPVIVIAELLGVSPGDRAFFRRCADRFLGIGADAETATEEELKQAFADAGKELDEYLIAEVRKRRATGSTDDLLGAVTAAVVDGERLSDVQVAVFGGLLLNAGHLTTTVLLGNTLLCLRDNPGTAEQLRADRSLVPGALEEVLRCRPPLHRALRVATEDVPIADGVIPADAFVMPLVVSANHDERQFPDPERFDIRRDPNKHLGFGRGIHYCLGAPLARLEAEVAVNLMLDEFTTIDVVGDPVFHESQFFGPKSLTVALGRSR